MTKILKQGMLKAVARLPGSKYECLCDCGKSRTVSVGHFNTGKIKSCGCHVVRHGHSGYVRSREYIAYHNMIVRCHKPSNKRFKDYGAKGVVVCERWRASFADFLADMGPCPDGMQIDREDNTKGYEPGNCKWATPKQNMANRSVTRKWVIDGQSFLSAADAAKEFEVSTSTIQAWCKGRTADGRYYPPRPGCSAELIYGEKK